MSPELRRRFFDWAGAWSDPFVVGVIGAIGAALVLSRVAVEILRRMGKIGPQAYTDVVARRRPWPVLAAALLLPIVFGSGWVMAGVAVLSLGCYYEFARATDLARETTVNGFVVFGILVVTFAVVDNYARLYFAAAALTVGLIAICTIPQDRPSGYLRRTSLGALGFLLFGYSFGYLGFFANSPQFRVYLLLQILCVELNDVFAYCSGRAIGGPKILPQTSPGKTWAGCIGAVVLTTLLVQVLGRFAFRGTPLAETGHLLVIGIGLSVLGQFGDLLLSSVKRDVGIKDLGTVIPGHGGLLDRFDSLVLVPPAMFHYVSLVLGPLGGEMPERIITG
jgi:phosphatidate cytidylyltransferase